MIINKFPYLKEYSRRSRYKKCDKQKTMNIAFFHQESTQEEYSHRFIHRKEREYDTLTWNGFVASQNIKSMLAQHFRTC